MPHAARKHIPRGHSEKPQDYRKNASKRGYDADWIKVRDQRRRLSPLCVECQKEGKVTSVEVVDHIIPIYARPDLRLCLENTQSLCVSHNTLKGYADIKKYGRPV